MKDKIHMIVMLTKNDETVPNAIEIFEECKDLPVDCWGFKDIGLPVNQMKDLVSRMKKSGKTTFLEVVRYSENEGLESAQLAAECGFDYLMGTTFFPSIADYLSKTNVKYSPFCGKVYGHPSILDGTIDEIIKDAQRIISYGVAGLDLLAYRYVGDINSLISEFLRKVKTQVILAGSINSWDRLGEVIRYKPWGFTIGSAFFDKKFVPKGTFRDQIEAVNKKITN